MFHSYQLLFTRIWGVFDDLAQFRLFGYLEQGLLIRSSNKKGHIQHIHIKNLWRVCNKVYNFTMTWKLILTTRLMCIYNTSLLANWKMLQGQGCGHLYNVPKVIVWLWRSTWSPETNRPQFKACTSQGQRKPSERNLCRFLYCGKGENLRSAVSKTNCSAN